MTEEEILHEIKTIGVRLDHNEDNPKAQKWHKTPQERLAYLKETLATQRSIRDNLDKLKPLRIEEDPTID